MQTRTALTSTLAALTLAALPVLAAPQGQAGGRGELLAELRAIESASHRERIRLLQEADTCIHKAQSLAEFRACERREQDAREALREELRPRREALRQKVEGLRERTAARAPRPSTPQPGPLAE